MPGSPHGPPLASPQLENLSTFIKAMVSYGMNPVDLFEANDLFESGNMTQVQVSLLALAGKVRPRERQPPTGAPRRCPRAFTGAPDSFLPRGAGHLGFSGEPGSVPFHQRSGPEPGGLSEAASLSGHSAIRRGPEPTLGFSLQSLSYS